MKKNAKKNEDSRPSICKFFTHEQGTPGVLLFDDSWAVSATEIGKAFGKRPKDWLRSVAAKRYIAALLEHYPGKNDYDFVIVIRDEFCRGTWMHVDVALEYARWVSLEFSLWADGIIDKKEAMVAFNGLKP